ANHPLAEQATICLRQLQNERLILPSGNAGALVLSCLEKAGLTTGHVLRGNKVTMIPDLVAAGAGLGLSPDFLVRRHRELHALKIADFPLEFGYDLVWRRDTEHAERMSILVSFLLSHDWKSQLGAI
ncbi:MAG: substrate-binding domain-containing protein, partial [Chloroflexota bacterium]|nr:substrate-binding domain-containing protein [Chloroflexota bacterium]